MAVASLIIVIVGICIIVIGVTLAFHDWKAKQRAEAPKRSGVRTEAAGLGKTIGALAKLAKALESYPLGMQLVFVGVLVIIIGGVFGGVSGLAACPASK